MVVMVGMVMVGAWWWWRGGGHESMLRPMVLKPMQMYMVWESWPCPSPAHTTVVQEGACVQKSWSLPSLVTFLVSSVDGF